MARRCAPVAPPAAVASFRFPGLGRFAKRLISLSGWVAEWFKAPVLKADFTHPGPSHLIPTSADFRGFCASLAVVRAELSRHVSCCPVPIPVPSFAIRRAPEYEIMNSSSIRYVKLSNLYTYILVTLPTLFDE
jgi:hypothetical protein